MSKGRGKDSYPKTTPNNPQPMPGRATPPDHIDGFARKTFFRVTQILEDCGTASKADVDLIEQYSINYARYVDAETQVKAQGLTQEYRGFYRTNPLVAISNECQKTMREILKELALTPAARKRLDIEGEKKENKFNQFKLSHQAV